MQKYPYVFLTTAKCEPVWDEQNAKWWFSVLDKTVGDLKRKGQLTLFD